MTTGCRSEGEDDEEEGTKKLEREEFFSLKKTTNRHRTFFFVFSPYTPHKHHPPLKTPFTNQKDKFFFFV